MKGAVLVLALLVTVELHVQPAEACVIFYEIFSKLALGFEKPLYYALDKVHATEPEKAAFEKIQDCYNEGGIKAKTLDSMALLSITFSKECLSQNLKTAGTNLAKIREYLTSLIETI